MMMRYIGRRIVQMIPTMFGVILITFVLFNLIGGSPGRMILGDKASARDLEAFDEQRGFNRPLFWGYFSPTRIYTETDFSVSAGPWALVNGVELSVIPEMEGLQIDGPVDAAIPLAFEYAPNKTYEWRIVFHVASGNDKVRIKASTNSLELTGTELRWYDRISEKKSSSHPVISVPADTRLIIKSLKCRLVNDQPWKSQWTHYLGQLVRFDFGRSHSANQSVADLLSNGIGPTLMLATPILVGETLLSLALALGCAYYRNRLFDRFVLVGCVMVMSVNYLVWIVAGQYWLGYRVGLFPVWGFESWVYLLLPVTIGILHGLGPNVRFYRTIMLEEMHKDYVRTARAKGAGTPAILFRHVLKNATIPVITNVVLSLPFLYTGSLLLETFFGIPGLGYLSVNAINSSDVDVVRAVVLIGSFLYLAANLLADLCYAWVDPRVRLT